MLLPEAPSMLVAIPDAAAMSMGDASVPVPEISTVLGGGGHGHEHHKR